MVNKKGFLDIMPAFSHMVSFLGASIPQLNMENKKDFYVRSDTLLFIEVKKKECIDVIPQPLPV